MNKFLACILTAFLLCVNPFLSGKAGAGQDIKVEVKAVNLSVLVFDGDRAIRLGKENFRVFEGVTSGAGQIWTEQNVESFARYDDQAVALAVMIDSSGSMNRSRNLSNSGIASRADKLEQAKNASIELFHAVFRQGKDKGLVSEFFYDINYFVFDPVLRVNRSFFANGTFYRFINTTSDGKYARASTSLSVDQDWSADLEEVKSGIKKIDKPGGATPLLDAAFNLAGCFEEVDGDLLRVAVILSDGWDSDDPRLQSGTKFNEKNSNEVMAEFQNRQILVYGVGLYQKNAGDVLEKIAKATGGLSFYEANSSKLTETFFRIGATIRSVNFVSYTPTDKRPGQRQIRVEVGEWDEDGNWHKKNYTIFHRQGYTYK